MTPSSKGKGIAFRIARATMWSVLNEGYLMTLWTSGRRPYTVTLSLQTAMPLEQFPIPLAALPKGFGL